MFLCLLKWNRRYTTSRYKNKHNGEKKKKKTHTKETVGCIHCFSMLLKCTSKVDCLSFQVVDLKTGLFLSPSVIRVKIIYWNKMGWSAL